MATLSVALDELPTSVCASANMHELARPIDPHSKIWSAGLQWPQASISALASWTAFSAHLERHISLVSSTDARAWITGMGLPLRDARGQHYALPKHAVLCFIAGGDVYEGCTFIDGGEQPHEYRFSVGLLRDSKDFQSGSVKRYADPEWPSVEYSRALFDDTVTAFAVYSVRCTAGRVTVDIEAVQHNKLAPGSFAEVRDELHMAAAKAVTKRERDDFERLTRQLDAGNGSVFRHPHRDLVLVAFGVCVAKMIGSEPPRLQVPNVRKPAPGLSAAYQRMSDFLGSHR